MALIHVFSVPSLRLNQKETEAIVLRPFGPWSSALSSKSVSVCHSTHFFFKAANVQSAVSLPGPGTGEQNEAGPFVIEWIPDLLPRCQMGELRITFEFGHEKSGQSDPCEKTNGTEKVGRKKSDSNQSKPVKTVEILTVVVWDMLQSGPSLCFFSQITYRIISYNQWHTNIGQNI